MQVIYLGTVIRLVILFLLPSRRYILELRLQKFKTDSTDENNFSQSNFRFAVVDFNRSESYPSNFVCMLPMKVGEGSVFVKVFGDKSLEQAKVLLTESLKREADCEVKIEIERRLKLLEPKQNSPIKCCSCGKLFQPRGMRRYKHHFCQECLRTSYNRR
jgi:hypothetical protein